MPALPEPIAHTAAAIYAAYERSSNRHERPYLGASITGDECDRKLWYGFHWAFEPETFNGQKLRLFQTGHLEEDRLIADLRAAGITVYDRDPATGEQWAVQALDGHFRGHLDGQVEGIPEAPKTRHVLECKSHNEKNYKELVSKGVEKAKPVHYSQMQVYMHLTGLERALYLAVNKNTDEVYSERVAYDPIKAGRLMAKAERIIDSARPPEGLPEKNWQCEFCPARSICRDGIFARRNCRTCLHASVVASGWRCELQDRLLPEDDQHAGCPSHRFIPNLVPGEQVDVDGDQVVYRLRGGVMWTDDGERP